MWWLNCRWLMAGARRLADAGIQACLQICNRRRHGRRWFGAPAVWPSKTALSALQDRLFRRQKRCWLQARMAGFANVLPVSRLRAHGAVRAINIKMLTAVSGRRQWQTLPRVMLVGGVRYSAACVFTFFELHNKTWMNSFFQVVTVVNRRQAPLLPSWACGHDSSGHGLR